MPIYSKDTNLLSKDDRDEKSSIARGFDLRAVLEQDSDIHRLRRKLVQNGTQVQIK